MARPVPALWCQMRDKTGERAVDALMPAQNGATLNVGAADLEDSTGREPDTCLSVSRRCHRVDNGTVKSRAARRRMLNYLPVVRTADWRTTIPPSVRPSVHTKGRLRRQAHDGGVLVHPSDTRRSTRQTAAR